MVRVGCGRAARTTQEFHRLLAIEDGAFGDRVPDRPGSKFAASVVAHGVVEVLAERVSARGFGRTWS